MNTTIQIRIDKKIKVKAQKIFESMGLDISSAVKMYFNQTINTKAIPFRIFSADYLPLDKKKKILKEISEAIESGQTFDTVREMNKYILNNND